MTSFSVSEKESKFLIKNLKKIEKALGVKIIARDNVVYLEGIALEEYEAVDILKAFLAGFDFKTALILKDEDYMLEEIRISDYAKKQRVADARARMIGTKGRALKTLNELSGCMVKVYSDRVFIMGKTEDVENAARAVISLIKGSRHGNVYAGIEHKPYFEEELGLKEEKKKVS